MPHFLALQSTYSHIECGLFVDTQCLDVLRIDKLHASKDLVYELDIFLRANKTSVNNLDFLVVNRGPAPFTTLRVAVTTANGIAYALNKPMVGVNVFEAFFAEIPTDQTAVLLLNAFGNELYFGIRKVNDQTLTIGCTSAQQLAQQLQDLDSTLHLYGNGIPLHQELFAQTLGKRLQYDPSAPHYSSIRYVGLTGLKIWNEQAQPSTELVMPLYLKESHPLLKKG